MKKLLILNFLATVLFSACENKPSYTINVEFSGLNGEDIVYMQLVKNNELETIDSVQIAENKVQFEGALDAPQMVYLKIGESRKIVNFFGENSEIEVKVNLDDLVNTQVVGSIVHDEFVEFQSYMSPIDQREQKLREDYREASMNGDQEKIDSLRKESENIYNDQQEMLYQYINDKSSSYMAPFVINRYLVYELDENELDSLLQMLDPSIHNSQDYTKLNERVEILKKVAVGQPAVDFTLNDPDGNPISLSSFRGKYVLIDFWASWCGPCRRENPNVVQLYSEYKDKGFEILGVSLDEDRTRWLGAIEADSLTWPHVSDLQGWGSESGKMYGIISIPATVLLDPEGIIIDKDLRGDALRQKLEELYATEEQNS